MTAIPLFDSTKVTPQGPREVVPQGSYICIIKNAKIKEAKTGGGQYLNLEIQIVQGPHKGRMLFDLLNLWNNSADAVAIAERQLAAICEAIATPQVSDTSQLYNKPLKVTITHEIYNEQPKEKVKGYEPAKDSQDGYSEAIPTESPEPVDDIDAPWLPEPEDDSEDDSEAEWGVAE